MSGRKNRTTNPTRYNKPKRSSSEQDARSVALGRSLVIRLDPDWEAQLEEMNRSKRGRPFVYPDLLMAGIAYLRYMIGKGVRITEGVADEMLGNGVKGPDHMTIWRRTCAQAVSIEGDRITIQTADKKTHILVADSTGITTTGKGRWIELKWNVKCNFIKLHILADGESQKILAFRITDAGGGDAGSLPGMLDQALDRLGIPLEDRGADPAVSVEVDSAPADENTVETVTEYMCDCGCCQPVAAERRVSKVKRPPVAIARGDGGYDSRDAFSHCRKRGVRTTIRGNHRRQLPIRRQGQGPVRGRPGPAGRRVHRRAVCQNGKGRAQETPEGVEGEGRVQQQVDGGDHNILVQAAAGRGPPGCEARVHRNRDRHQDSRV